MKGREKGYASHSTLWVFRDLGADRGDWRALVADSTMLGV